MTEPQRQESLGPYLQVACFCETVVQRADGVLTLVNVVDRVNLTSQGPSAPQVMPITNWQASLVIVLKAGRARGRYQMRIVPELPDGSAKEPAVISVNFEGEDDRGIQIINKMVLALTHEGLYWFKVYLGNDLLAKLPLRVVYTAVTGGALGPGSGGR